jgi:hypothetical protein
LGKYKKENNDYIWLKWDITYYGEQYYCSAKDLSPLINLLLPVNFDRIEDFTAFFSMSATLISIAGIGTLFIKKSYYSVVKN